MARAAIVNVPAPSPIILSRPRYGAGQEFTLTTGLSRMSGHWLGYRRDVDVEVINLRYAAVFARYPHVTISYAMEATPYINIEEPILNNNDNGTTELYRKQTVGGGFTPIGFTSTPCPAIASQPFWRCNYGVLYFHDRVLSPQGSQFMHTVDFGVGVHLFTTPLAATTVGFRYIHMSNANIAIHNPGTDAETFYLGFSRYHAGRNRHVVR